MVETSPASPWLSDLLRGVGHGFVLAPRTRQSGGTVQSRRSPRFLDGMMRDAAGRVASIDVSRAAAGCMGGEVTVGSCAQSTTTCFSNSLRYAAHLRSSKPSESRQSTAAYAMASA